MKPPFSYFLTLFFLSSLSAEIGDPTFAAPRQRDFEAVQEFVNSKRTIPLDEKESCLKITGDVKVDMLYRRERLEGEELRGRGTAHPHFTSEVEADLFFNYKGDHTSARVQLNFDNQMGIIGGDAEKDPQGLIGSGECGDLCVKTCYWNWNFFNRDCHKLSLQVGRNKLYRMFDSRIEFNSLADGVLFEWKKTYQPDWAIYWKTLGFVVDARANHLSFVTEIGTLDFMETKFDAKYSFIDWKLKGHNRAGTINPPGLRFAISQWGLAYNYYTKWEFCKKARWYGAFLVNTAAKSKPTAKTVDKDNNPIEKVLDISRENIGWYAGMIIGDVKNPGDWSLDMNYQYVQAQAIPDPDNQGIGNGNVKKNTLYANGLGKGNYKGWHFEGLYQISKSLAIDVTFNFSSQIKRSIGGDHFYSIFETDFIYEF